MTYSGRYEGFSFAIPSNLAQKIIYDLKEFGAVQRGWLGITINNVDDQKAKDLNLHFVGGVFIERVDFNGAAKEAGLRNGDVIIAVNGVETETTPEFMEQVARHRPGDKINIRYFRGGKGLDTDVVLRNQLNTTEFVAIRKDKVLLDLGFELRNLDENEKKRLNTDGIYVVSIYRGSTIEDTNMDPGYVITRVNKKKVENVDDIINVLKKAKGEILLEGFYENYPGEFPYKFDMN
jgi:S1-C subfamily serine protease